MRKNHFLLGLALASLGGVISVRAEGFFSDRGYLGFSGGVALQQNITLQDDEGQSAEATFNPGFHLDFTAGLETPKGWAFEFETGVIHNSFDEIGGVSLSSTGDNLQMLAVPFLFNVLIRPKISESLTACVGVRAGGVATTFYSEYGFFDTYSSDFAFGYQALAGFNYQAAENWDIGLAYKFLGTTDHDLGFGVKSGGTFTHSFLICVRFRF